MREQSDQIVQSLCKDFRYHLEQFYSYLHLAPPYNSVEKAVRFFSTALQQKSQEERQEVAENIRLQWELFEQSFVDSGLPQKHRGIIRGLVQSNDSFELPPEYSVFIKPFLSNT